MSDIVSMNIVTKDVVLGFCLILMGAVGVLYKKLNTLYRERNDEKNEISEKLFELMEKRVESDVKYEQAFRHLRKMVEQLVERL